MDNAKERARLLRQLRDDGRLVTPRVERALETVARELFLPAHLRGHAYEDRPLPIGSAQTISAPHMVAIMAEALELEPGQNVLEIGTGSGYHAAVTAVMVGPSGHVQSLESIEDLAGRARAALAQAGLAHVDVECTDGSQGWPPRAPYDRIYATCAAPAVPPPLLDQLKATGVLLVPIGHDPSRLVRVRAREGARDEEDLGPCSFVPMTGEYGLPE